MFRILNQEGHTIYTDDNLALVVTTLTDLLSWDQAHARTSRYTVEGGQSRTLSTGAKQRATELLAEDDLLGAQRVMLDDIMSERGGSVHNSGC
jgi:hypothetical protein